MALQGIHCQGGLCLVVHQVGLLPAILEVWRSRQTAIRGSSAARWVRIWAECHVIISVHVSPSVSRSRQGSPGGAFPAAVGRWGNLST